MTSSLIIMRLRAVSVALAFLAIATAPLASPLAAQDAQEEVKMGGKAFKTTLGATLLMPMADVGTTMAEDRLPSGRAVLEIQSNPVFGFHLGALRLAPNIAWGEGTQYESSTEPHRQLGLMAGIVGFRLNFTTGRLRIAPFADGGAGQMQARTDVGGYEYRQGGVQSYAPLLVDSTTLMAGGGGGLAVDAILGPGLTLALVGGYWHWMPVGATADAGAGSGDAFFEPLSGIYAGAGVKLAFKSESYYWRHSGQDTRPPTIAVTNPEPEEDGVIDVGTDLAMLNLRVTDQSDVDSVKINGQRLRLIPLTDGERGVSAQTQIELSPGVNKVTFAAYDGAGNRIDGVWDVLGIPLDEIGPEVTFLTPEDGASVDTDRVSVSAIIKDRSPIGATTLNGFEVRLDDPTQEELDAVGADVSDFVKKVAQNVQVLTSEFPIEVATVDSAGNQGGGRITVRRAGIAAATPPTPQPAAQASIGPRIEIHSPTEWAAGGTRGFAARPKNAILVRGQVVYPEGVREVLANGSRLSLNVSANNAVATFSGFVDPPAPGSQGEVEILARGMDGVNAVRTFRAQTSRQTASGPELADQILTSASKRQRWAVVIGISDYLDPTIPDLQYADDDARAMYEFLRSPAAGMGGMAEDHIRLLVDEQATEREIRSALTTFLRRSTDDDVIFIYIAGHGAPDPYRPDDLYILAHDTEMDDLAATGVGMNLVNRAIRDAYAYNKVLITDACHSAGVGAGTRSGSSNAINSMFLDYMDNSSGGFVAFTASESNQLSQEGEQFGGGHGAFTHFFLEGLNGEADEDGDRVVTLGEVMEYTRDRVRRATLQSQIPTISSTAYDRFWPMAAVFDGDDQ